MAKEFPRTLVLFDVDGTLTKPRAPVTIEMEQFLEKLKTKVDVGLVGGSDLAKIAEQMTALSDDTDVNITGSTSEKQIEQLVNKYDYIFAENGLIAYHNGKLIGKQSILDKLGEQRTQRLINFVLKYFSELSLPCKRGNFIEFRNGLINVSPIGRSCSRAERNEFYEYDKQHGIRKQLIQALHDEFDKTDLDMEFAIGGQISVDCYPHGWDKRFCLQFVEHQYDKIYFYGDKTSPGGNDHAVYEDHRTIGNHVDSPEQTIQLLKEVFFK